MPYHPFCRTIVIQNEDIEKGFHCIYGNEKSNLLCVHQPIGKFGWYLPIFELNSTSHPEELGHKGSLTTFSEWTNCLKACQQKHILFDL